MSAVVSVLSLTVFGLVPSSATVPPSPATEDVARHGSEPVPAEPWQKTLRRVRAATPLAESGTASAVLPATVTTKVVVFTLNTPDGPHGAGLVESRAMIQRLDQEFNSETGGSYRFAFHSLVSLPDSTSDMCGVFQIRDEYHSEIQAVMDQISGARTWVVVTAEQSCVWYAGQATLGGAGVHINGPRHWVPVGPAVDPGADGYPQYLDVAVLAHEIGHNLGLEHAASVVTNGTTTPIGPFSMRIREYGDTSDIMGGANYSMRLNTYNRHYLGVLPSEAIAAAVQASQTFTVSALDSPNGIRMVVVPLNETRTYLVEYRPATGRDWPMRYETADDHGGAGVYIRTTAQAPERNRLFDDVGDLFPTLVLPSAMEVEPGADTSHFGLATGEFMDLPGNVRIAVGAITDTSAEVTVTRPGDSSAPPIPLELCAEMAELTGRDDCTAVNLDEPLRLDIRPDFVADDTWTKRLTVTLDGEVVSDLSLNTPTDVDWDAIDEHVSLVERGYSDNRDAVFTVTIPRGQHSVTATVTDLVGNVRSRTWRVSNTDSRRPPSPPGKPSLTRKSRSSVLVTWAAPASNGGSTISRYRVQASVNGRGWKEVRKVWSEYAGRPAPRRTLISALRVGSTYRFRVAAGNDSGFGLYSVASAKLRLGR